MEYIYLSTKSAFLEWFLNGHVKLKTGVMAAANSALASQWQLTIFKSFTGLAITFFKFPDIPRFPVTPVILEMEKY